MKTKFMNLKGETKQVKKKIVFTHMLCSDLTIQETNDNPEWYNYVQFIGTNKYYGSMFKVWNEGSDNTIFDIYFGIKGDEFPD